MKTRAPGTSLDEHRRAIQHLSHRVELLEAIISPAPMMTNAGTILVVGSGQTLDSKPRHEPEIPFIQAQTQRHPILCENGRKIRIGGRAVVEARRRLRREEERMGLTVSPRVYGIYEDVET